MSECVCVCVCARVCAVCVCMCVCACVCCLYFSNSPSYTRHMITHDLIPHTNTHTQTHTHTQQVCLLHAPPRDHRSHRHPHHTHNLTPHPPTPILHSPRPRLRNLVPHTALSRGGVSNYAIQYRVHVPEVTKAICRL